MIAVNLKKPLLRVLEKSDAKDHAAASGTGLVALRKTQQCETAALEFERGRIRGEGLKRVCQRP